MVNKQYLAIINTILSKYLDLQHDSVFIFGSRAAGTEQTFSDIDIGIESTHPVKRSTIVKMQGDFEDSDLPFTVDVVDFTHVSERFKKLAKQQSIPLHPL